MYESTQDAIWVHSIDLAREPDFDLGLLRVRPASCEVQWNGVAHSLQRRVMQVLVALAQANGAVVSQDDLVIRCWRGLAVSDDAIYRCISILRKLAADYSDAPFAIEAIPGVGYRLTASSSSQAASLVETPAARDRRFRLGLLTATAALAALILMGAFFWPDRGGVPSLGRPMPVAVHAFDTLSNSEDARALARRIPDEIVNEFGDSQIETVLESSAARPGLKPGLIVTGLLRDEAPHVIVDVRIEDGTTRAAIWSMEFSRDRREASDLPLEVAARVADIVNMAIFARTAKPPLTDNSALSALLQTTDIFRDANGGAWAQMLENAQSLVARHPEFAFGHSVLASAYGEAADSIAVPAHAKAMRDAARREAELTLKLDPQDAGAYSVLEGIEPTYNYAAREAILLRGLKVAKHPKQPLGALYSYEGTLLSSVGRVREALSFQLIARATDEWGPPKTAKLIRNYASLGNLDASRSWLDRAVRRWPNHSAVRAMRLEMAGFYELPSDGLAILDAIAARTPADKAQTEVWRVFIEAKAARSPQAISAATRTIMGAGADGKITRETEVMMLAGLGQTERAIAAANRALDRQQLDPRFLFTPVMRDVRRSPGFVNLAARMGLIKYWRETGKRPDFCTGSTAASACSPQLIAALGAAN
jgi:DNA-binding winged helix-turn-helix (wHTH) protein/TolB-like protein/tetratricopeptide (TPR) repeat protein